MRKVFAVIALMLVILPAKYALCAEADPDLAKEVEIGRKAAARINEEWPLNRTLLSKKRVNNDWTNIVRHMNARHAQFPHNVSKRIATRIE